MKTPLAVLCAAALLVPPATPAQAPLEGDLAKVQGRWKAMVGPNQEIPIVMEIKDQTVLATFKTPKGEDVPLKGEIRLDDAPRPKTWDWVKFTRPDGSEAPPNLAVYELDGDTLTICNGGPGRPRPGELKAGEAGPPHLVIFRREKAGVAP